jgi:hypothetical protein
LVLFAVVVVIALVLSAVVAVAALLDPFDWVPPLGVVFGSCGDAPAKARRGCDWGSQYPGFWGHVIANLVYDVLAVAALVAFTVTAREHVGARRARYDGPAALDRYAGARANFVLASIALGAMAALPIIAAVA